MVHFEPLTAEEFKHYWTYSVNSWKQNMVRAGLIDSSVTYDEAEIQIRKFLPKGLKTPNHYFMHIVSDEGRIGTLWLEIRKKRSTEAYLWDIYLNEEHRGKGHGKSAMARIHRFAREKGATKISLNVFAYNEIARSLYRKVGYQDAAITMMKYL